MANLSQHAGGGNLYAPAYTAYDGVDDDVFFEVVPDSTNKITASFGFKIGSFTSNQFLIYTKNAQVRFMAVVVPSTDADNPNKVWIRVINSSGTIICQLYSIGSVTDSEWHSLFLAFDGDAGTAIFKIDGADADNVAATGRIAPTTGTLEGSQDLTFANLHDGISPTTGWTAVSLTEVVYDDSYLTNWEDFSSGSSMTQLDRDGWAEFDGNQPQIYSPAGQGWDNLGSVGAPTSGNVTEVVIASVPTGLGLDTTATAVDADIAAGKTAWVNGLQVTGTLVPGASLTSKVLVKYDFSGPNATAIDVADYEVWRDPSVTVAVGTDGTRDIFDGGLHTAATYLLFGLDMPTLAADTARVYTVTGRVAGLGATDGHLDMCIDQDGLNNVGTAYYLRMILSSGMHRTNFFRRDAWADSYPFGSGVSAHFNANDLFFTNTVIQTDTALQGSVLMHSISGQRGVGFGGGSTDLAKRNSQYASIAFWPGNSEIRVDSISVIDIPNPV